MLAQRSSHSPLCHTVLMLPWTLFQRSLFALCLPDLAASNTHAAVCCKINSEYCEVTDDGGATWV